MRIVQENMAAIKEITELRQYLAASKLHQQEQSVLASAGVGQAPPAAPGAGGDADGGDDAQQMLESQRAYIQDLRQRVGEVEKMRGESQRKALSSRERLEPIGREGGAVMHG